MTASLQALRTTTNVAPAPLLPGEFFVELGPFTKLWIGSASGNRLLLSSDPSDITTSSGRYLQVAGGTMLGALVLAADAVNPLEPVALEQLNAAIAAIPLGNYALLDSPVFINDPTAPTAPPGDNDTSLATTAFVTAAVAPALNDGGRNLIHNPMMNIAQRGVGVFTTSGYTLDRWALYVNTDAASISQQPMVFAGDEAATRCLTNVFTGSAGATAQHICYQPIEGVSRLAGKTVTVSFYAVATAGTPKLAVSIDQLFGTGGAPHARVNGPGQATTALTPGWVRYRFTFNIPSISGFTLGTNNDDATWLNFWFSNAVAADAARSGNLGVQSGSVAISGVQLEIGTVMTPVDKPYDRGADLRDCQRFYQAATLEILGAAYIAGAYVSTMVNFPLTMRANPTIAPTWTTTTNTTAPGVTPMSAVGLLAYVQGTAAGTVVLIGSFAASADL